jgi:hypothetical protein
MGLTIDISSDYLLWDNTEAGTLTNTSGAGDTDVAVATTMAADLSRQELAASDGVYTPRDKTWSIPAALLSGYEPKPRDIWTDTATGTEWTALEVRRAAIGSSVCHYVLTCRNLVLESSLTDSIDIQRSAVTYDAAGAIVQTWPPDGGSTAYAALACRVQTQTSEAADEAGIRDQETTIWIYLSRQVAINVLTDRVKFGSAYYDIERLRNPERIDELPVLEVKLRP